MRIAAVLVPALVALVAAGAATARDPREPKQRHTAADTAWARSVALVRGDLATDWKVLPPEKSPPPPCSTAPDESRLVQTAKVDPTFVWKDGVTTLESEVDVFRTAAMAKRDWRLTAKLGLARRCLLEATRRSVGKATRVRLRSAATLKTRKLGERSLHFKIVLELGSTKVVPIAVEMIGFGIGRTSVVLSAVYSPRVPVPPAQLNALAAKLAKRLVGASGGI